MQRWIIPILIVISIGTSYLAVKYGMKPKAISIITASNFVSPQELAKYIQSQLFQNLHEAKAIVFGLEKTHSPFLDQTVDDLKKLMKRTDPDWNPEFFTLDADDTFTRNTSDHLKKFLADKREHTMIFTFVGLDNIKPADTIVNCEELKDQPLWLECSRQRKAKEILMARKINTMDNVGILEQTSSINYVIYFRDQIKN